MVAHTASSVLARGRLLVAGNWLLAEVPPAQSWIVKSINVHSDVPTAIPNLLVYAVAASSGTAVYFLNSSLESAKDLRWDGWVVLEPGDQVGLSTTDGVVHAWISGAVLIPQSVHSPPPVSRVGGVLS